MQGRHLIESVWLYFLTIDDISIGKYLLLKDKFCNS